MTQDKDYTFDINDFTEDGLVDCISLLKLYYNHGGPDGFIQEGVKLAFRPYENMGLLVNNQGQAIRLTGGKGAERLILCQIKNKELDFS